MQDGCRIFGNGKSSKTTNKNQHHKFPSGLGYPKPEGKDEGESYTLFRTLPPSRDAPTPPHDSGRRRAFHLNFPPQARIPRTTKAKKRRLSEKTRGLSRISSRLFAKTSPFFATTRPQVHKKAFRHSTTSGETLFFCAFFFRLADRRAEICRTRR